MAAPTERLKSYLDRILPAASPLEALAEDRSGLESLAERKALPKSRADMARNAVQKASTGKALTPPEQFALEAIIIPDQRPAIDIVDGDYAVSHPFWTHFVTDPAIHANIRRAIPAIGRIELPNHPSLPYGGTGFVVGADLVMTNRHVAEIFASGLGLRDLVFRSGLTAGIDFKRERGRDGSTFLTVREVAMIHPYWDMALLRVEGLAPEQAALSLALRDPDALVDTEVAVIGYPAFDPRNDAAVQNEVFGGVYYVKRLQPGKIMSRAPILSFGKTVSAIRHDSSTLGGDSGAAVVEAATGKVIALHFGGVYLDANYGVPVAELGRDGRVTALQLDFDGRPSPGAAPWEDWWRRTDPQEAPAAPPATAPEPAGQPALRSAGPDGATWTIPIEISIRLGTPTAAAAAVPAAAAMEAMVEPTHDADYSTRRGYDAGFLGVPVPPPGARDADSVVRFAGGETIPYHHFSLALHKARRIALFTASNLDGSAAAKKPDKDHAYDRKSLGGLGRVDMEKWFIDPRIDPRFQLPDRFFTKDRGAFDKGHIVRREDVAWGRSFEEVRFANGDTFHVTNCSPQVSGFNQSAAGQDNWGDLENYVMKQAAAEKLCLFAGPVLAEDDPIFVGVDDIGPVRVKIPRQYWKVVVAASDGSLQSFGFVLRQDLADVPLEFVVDAVWQKYMVPLAALEALNPLVRFPDAVRAADQSGRAGGEAVRRSLAIAMAPAA